jgi:hypothetical protein
LITNVNEKNSDAGDNSETWQSRVALHGVAAISMPTSGWRRPRGVQTFLDQIALNLPVFER